MPKYRFLKLAAIVVLVGFAAWMVTGEFSSVGSAAADNEPKAGEVEQPKAADASKAKP
ncbi:efflux transporter periplasmic adaptor subunit, partial [Mesorhizobium sp. M5C.F.Ca.IN.020.14.1.1]